MAEKKSFILYTEYIEQFSILSDEQAGKLIKAIFTYSAYGTEPEFDDSMLKMAFIFIKNNLDRNFEKWEEKAKSSK